MPTIFERILADAQRVAADETSLIHVPEDFATRSELTEPTHGFSLPATADGKTPYGYQAAAVQTNIEYRRTLVGFSPGMGKTLVATYTVNHLVTVEKARVIVVCPPTLRIDPWERELALQFPNLNIAWFLGGKQGDVPIGTDVLIVPDSITLSKRLADIEAWRPTALVVDECQRFKGLRSKRTEALQKIAEMVDANTAGTIPGVIIGLTGTLAKNTPEDVFPPLRALGEKYLKAMSGGTSFALFRQRWCFSKSVHVGGGNFLEKTTGMKDGLHEQLRKVAYIRVERSEVLDMPEKVWVPRAVTLADEDRRNYDKMEKDFIKWIRDTKGDEFADKFNVKAEAIVKLMKLWQAAGEAKAKATADYIESLTSQDEQVVVMGWHKSAVQGLLAELASRGITFCQVVGGMSTEAKVDAQDAFRNGEAQVLVANIVAAGTGLNLDCAHHLVFMQVCWSPGDLIQASDRIYRVTQMVDCTVHVLNAWGTVDEKLWGVLQHKAHIVDSINSGGCEVTIDTGEVERLVLEAYGWEDDAA